MDKEFLLMCQQHLIEALEGVERLISLAESSGQQKDIDDAKFKICMGTHSARYELRRAFGHSQYIEED